MNLAFIGFGNVARAFARLLASHSATYTGQDSPWKTTAIATANHGCITSSIPIDLVQAAECIERGGNLTEIPASLEVANPIQLIESCDADILVETTPLDVENGEPAITHIRRALGRGMHVVTANKGPIAFAYSELKALANERRLCFLFEGTVMDGAPVFNLVERCLPGTRVVGFTGVLNSTTNLILTGMEKGQPFEEALSEAQRRGIAEANSDYDVDGWDAAVKAVALANVLMDANARPSDVDRTGIRDVKIEDLRAAVATGMTMRLVARGIRSNDGLLLTVSPQIVPIGSALGAVRGTSNVLVLETDLMGDLAIFEHEPGVEQTAYGLLSDLLRIHELERAAGATQAKPQKPTYG